MDTRTFEDVGTSRATSWTGALGWLSIALGAGEIMAPRALARLVGLRPSRSTRRTLRAYGLRELATGVSALRNRARSAPLWARVAGDALDIGSLMLAARRRTSNGRRAALALVGLAAVTVLDIVGARCVAAAEA